MVGGGNDMLRTAALAACIAIAGAIAWTASRTPAPRSATAAAAAFSAERAYADVAEIGSEPHPLGSAEHDRVRDYLAGRCRELGLEVRVGSDEAIAPTAYPTAVLVDGANVQDIVCTLRGRNRSRPALGLMAHYDTVPSSPGAADDSTGVAAALETVRALEAKGPPLRDVLLLFTDGEEAGLLGARALFASGDMGRRLGLVLNMEAHGGGGRVYMFETGAHDGQLIDLFRRTAVNPTAASLSGYVYAQMPAGTDFTIARDHGVTGLNFAFEGLPFDYHAASSTPAALDRGSLQHMGDQVLSVARAVAFEPELPKAAPDVVYADLLGGPIVAYPVWAGWLLLAGAAGVLAVSFRRAFASEPFGWASALRGAGALILTAVAAGLVLLLIREGTGAGVGLLGEKPLLARFGLYEAALAAGCLGSALACALIAGEGRSRFWSAYSGACALGLALALGLQVLAPLTAYLATWPLLIAAVLAAALAFRWEGSARAGSAQVFAAALAVLPLAQLLYTAHPIALSIGAELPAVFAVFTVLAALMLFPLLWPHGRARTAWALGVLALLIALGCTLALRLTRPWSPRHPRPAEVVYVADLDHGRFLRASPLPRLDAWTRRALMADSGGAVGRQPLAPFARRAWTSPARPIAIVRPQLSETRSGDTVTLTLTPGGGARELVLEFEPTTPVSAVTVDGRMAAASVPAGRHIILDWRAPGGPVSMAFHAPDHSELAARYAQIVDGWPADAPRPPAPSPSVMPWGDAGSTVLLGSAHYGW
jgi:hypothetical protein